MYRQPAFREDCLEVMHDLIRSHPLGSLVTASPHGLIANLIPFLVDAHASEHGTLRAHLAKANDHVPVLRDDPEALIIFRGPQAYVSPSWYPAKAIHGKVVPTWHYAVVQVRGRPRIIDDPSWIRAHVDALTLTQEQGRENPWAASDAPEKFLAGQLKAIVGIEIEIAAIEGKFKLSQNYREPDQLGIAKGMRDDGAEAAARLNELASQRHSK
ncbi:MAG: FMN-binding negative transcriptional regulator [Sphingomonas sp.]|nr:FMN-binding negative transcriptional regulator [Sphingomonas sp.]